MNEKIKELLENAEQSDAIARNKWRIENREQLRKERKEKLKELMEKDKQQTAVKLYTEDQVRKMLEVCIDSDLYEHILTFEDILKTQKPIELMTYDELMYIIEPCLNTTDEFDKGFKHGVQWILEKIEYDATKRIQ
jgi:hypothetical protein